MTYKLLDATATDDFKLMWFDIEYKNKILRFTINKIKNNVTYIIKTITHKLEGKDITSLGIPEDLKNYIEDPLFEIELEKLIHENKNI